MFEFGALWLFLLLPLPLLVRRLLPAYRSQEAAIQAPMLGRLAAATGQEPAEGAVLRRATRWQRILGPLVWLLLVVAVARPVWVEPPIVHTQSARDLMLCVDLSGSMESEDFLTPTGERQSRLDAVKQVLDGFIERREADRIGLIVFGSAPYLQAPFTQDHRVARYLLGETRVRMAGPQTMLGDAIGFAITRFEDSQATERVLILLTDGNDTGSRMPPSKAAQIAADHGITIHTISVGDPAAVGETALDVEALQVIADTTGGRYFHADDGASLEAIYRSLDELAPSTFETLSYRPKVALFMWPLGLIVLLGLLYHTVLAVLTWRAQRRPLRA